MPDKITNPFDILIHKLNNLKASEQKIKDDLSKFSDAAKNQNLRSFITTYQQDTEKRRMDLEEGLRQNNIPDENIEPSLITGISNELNILVQKKLPETDIDLSLLSELQTITAILLLGYSYTANLAFALNSRTDFIEKLNQAFKQLSETDRQITEMAKQEFDKVKQTQGQEKLTQTQQIQQRIEDQKKQLEQLSNEPLPQQQQHIEQLKQQITQQDQQIQQLQQTASQTQPSQQEKQQMENQLNQQEQQVQQLNKGQPNPQSISDKAKKAIEDITK